MSKELKFSRKPTPQQPDPQESVDKWVERRAAGESLQEPEQAIPPEKIVRMTFDLSKSLHRRFRNTCHNLDRNMTDELRAFVVRYLEENEGKQS
jgi:hypothetical protein